MPTNIAIGTVAATVEVDRTHNILADSTLPLTVEVQTFAYAKQIKVSIGLTVAA